MVRQNIKKFGLPIVVAINHFEADTENETNILKEECKKIGIDFGDYGVLTSVSEGSGTLLTEFCINCLTQIKLKSNSCLIVSRFFSDFRYLAASSSVLIY